MEEIWKTVAENPKYQVSNLGNVKGPRGYLLSATRNNTTGHVSINWKMNGKLIQRYVHKLVLEAFVGPCPAGLEVLHKDDCPANNALSNLRYGTHAENMRALPGRFSDEDVRFIRLRQHYQWEYADHFKVSVQTIQNIHRRVTYAHI